MAKTKQSAGKKAKPAAPSIGESLQNSLFQQQPSRAARHEEPPPPTVGDKVTFPQSDTVYTISRVSPSGTQVDLRLEGTNIERFRVPVADLNFLDQPRPRKPAPPPKPAIDVEGIREHLSTARHSSIDQLSGDIAVLKKYLKSKGVRASAIEELDSLCDATEKQWAAAIEEILNSLPD